MGSTKISWMIGGAQGTGVDSSANVFSRAAAIYGLYVFGKREYYSNIKGEHSYFSVVISDKKVHSTMDEVHLLATFDSETIVRHAWEVVGGGGIIYDSMAVNEKITSIPTIEKPVVERVQMRLSKEGVGETVGDVLEVARRNGVRLYPIPYMELLKKVGELTGEQQLSALARMTNTIAVGVSLNLLSIPMNYLETALAQVFRAKAKVVKSNVLAAEVAAEYVRNHFSSDFPYRVEPQGKQKKLFISGTSAVALGKIVAGCRFQTYYPITPASDESVYLEDHQVFDLYEEYPHLREVEELNGQGSIVVVQTEDEISAINMVSGAALAGARAATATSGPGLDLMIEGIGWAGMNEVPIVITLYQRGGPSTGLPTRHEQGELLFSIFGGHGEFPRLVLASGDIEEAFYDVAKAFNYAERYQTPVIHILDKALANSTMTVDVFDVSKIRIDRGKLITSWDSSLGTYKRFKFSEDGISYRTVLGVENGIFWNTGDEHDELGHITEEPSLRDRMMEKRMKKLEIADAEIPDSERVILFGDYDAPFLILSWGSTKGAILDAIDHLSSEGLRFAFAQVKLLNPFPTRFLQNLTSQYRKIIVVEQNYSGQFATLLRARTGIQVDHLIVKYNGRPFSFSELRDGLKEAVIHGSPRIVKRSGG
ncbi:MAG: 2-oxoacid:ferredoxin oxidoreductase subunit alpha [Candidatus Caldarchaeum sp.]|nr:2-oxoacid:ferredoxin oxidoreductase subunit alpha [Candidatus Caldarchaeum sp.]